MGQAFFFLILRFCAPSSRMLLLWLFESWCDTELSWFDGFFTSRTPWRRWRRQWPVKDPGCRGTASRRSSLLPLIWHQYCPLLRPPFPHARPSARPRCRLVSRPSPSISACRAEEEEDLGARHERKGGAAERGWQGRLNGTTKWKKVFLLIIEWK